MQPNDNPLKWPKQADKARIQEYHRNDLLYKGKHFAAFSIKVKDTKFNTEYERLRYIAANFPGLMSRVLADMLFGEPIHLDIQDKNSADFINAVIHENDLINQLYESALINSRRGFDVFKIRIGQRNPLVTDSPSTIIIEQVGADKYFPVFDSKAARNVVVQDVIAVTFNQEGKTYLHKEIHTPGKIEHEVYLYDPEEEKVIATANPEEFGIPVVEETGVKRSLVFGIPNYRDGEFYGTSDYADLEQMIFALNNRMTKTDNILDKHSDPILAVPPGVIDENGKVKKEQLGMFEVDSENPGFNKPEYIVWNANLESAFKQIDKLVDFLFMFSEIAPATMGADKDGQAESGRALKFKLLSTIRKRNRKISYYDQAIKEMLYTAQELAKAKGVSVDGQAPGEVEKPKIKWGDGIINDQTEMVDISGKRILDGTMSRADAIVYLDDVTKEEADEKVGEIDQEQQPTTPVVVNNTAANQDNSEDTGNQEE